MPRTSEIGFFGDLSFWRCMRHFWAYLGYLDECQRGVRKYSDPPPKILRRRDA